MTDRALSSEEGSSSRQTVIEADITALEGKRSEGRTGPFTVYADELPRVGGEGTAPTPLRYFCLALGFWLLSQIGQFGPMLKVNITGARVHVQGSFWRQGSVLAGTVQSSCEGMEVRLELDSPDDPARVAQLVRIAEQSCFVMQVVANPVPIHRSAILNGQELEVGAASHSSAKAG